MTRSFATAVIFFLVSLMPAAANCLSQGEAQQAVASGQALPLGAVAGSVGGEIVKAQLCVEGGRYVYRLAVLANGQVTTVVVNASR